MSLFPAYTNESNDLASTSATTPTFPAYRKEETANTSKAGAEAEWLRFSSFKPPATVEKKPAAKSDSEKIPPPVIDISDDAGGERIVKKEQKREKKRRKRRSSPESKPEISKKKIKKSPPTNSAPWKLLKKSDFLSCRVSYIIDKKRDVENFRYDTVYKTHLARYHSKFRRCLGNENQRIDALFFEKRTSANYERGSKKLRRYFDRKNKKSEKYSRQKIVIKNDKITNIFPEFVPVENFFVDSSGEKLIYDSKLQMYKRSDENKNLQDEIFEENFEDFWAENRRLNKIVNRNPTEADAWLRLIDLQDRIFAGQGSIYEKDASKNGSNNDALLDRKMVMAEKAVTKNAQNVDLKLLRIRLGRESGWDESKLREEWRKLEFNFVNNPKMWIARLQFGRGHFSSFTVTRQNALFDHCSERLFEVLSGKLLTHRPWSNAERFFVDCIMGKIYFLFDAGYAEQAAASIQAILEFNFRQPDATRSLNVEIKRNIFEPFWDYNRPRIGENGALAWMDFAKRAGAENQAPEEFSQNENLADIEDELCSRIGIRDALLWSDLERLRETHHRLPFRGTDEPEDPQRAVLFDDISGILYDIKEPENLFRLFLDTLRLCGMHFPQNFDRKNDTFFAKRWYDDETQIFDALTHFDTLPPINNFILRDENFLGRLLLEGENLWPRDSPYLLYLNYSRFFDQASNLMRDENLSPKEKLKRYKNVCKRILEEEKCRENILFYSAYAENLTLFESLEEAEKIVETIVITRKITFRKSIDQNSNFVDRLSVLKSICLWLENRLGRMEFLEETVKILACWICTGEWPTRKNNLPSTHLLKCKKILAEFREFWSERNRENSENSNQFLVQWLGTTSDHLQHLEIMLDYACTYDLKNAQHGYGTARQNHGILEKNFRREIQLVQRHLKYFPAAPPKLLLESVQKALDALPTCAGFLKIFIDYHLKGGLIMKLRRFFVEQKQKKDQCKLQESPVWWTAVIYAEFSRYLLLKSEGEENCTTETPHGLRHVLKNAVQSCPNNAVLWRLYFALESRLGGGREELKKAFFMAIRQCPWSKSLYTDVLILLPEEVQNIVDLMTEKELRVRVPWEELQLLKKVALQKRNLEEKPGSSEK